MYRIAAGAFTTFMGGFVTIVGILCRVEHWGKVIDFRMTDAKTTVKWLGKASS